MANAGYATVEIRPDFSKFNRELNSQLSSAGKKISSFGGSLTKSVTLPIVGIGAAAAGIGLATAAGLEQSQIAFKSFYGDAETAQKVMQDIKDFASATPFDLPGLTTAAQKMASVGVEADELIPLLGGVGDAVAGVGGGAQQIDQVAFAMQQVIGQGRAMTQDINQIASTGIPIWGELAAQMGVTEAEIRDLASEGAITDEILQQAFTNPVGPLTNFSGLMEEQSQTLAGLWSTLKDEIAIGLADSFQESLPAIKDAIGQLTEALGPALEAAGPAFSALVQAMTPLIGVVADVLTWFAQLSPEMQRLAVFGIAGAAALGPFLGVFGKLVSGVGAAVKVVGGLSTFSRILFQSARALGLFAGVAKVGRAFFGFARLVAGGIKVVSLALVTNPIVLIIAAIVAAVALAGYLIYRNWDTIKAAFAAAWEFIQPIVQAIWDFLVSAFQAVVDVIKSVWETVVTVFQAIVDFLTPIFEVLFAIITLPFRIWWAVVSAILQLAWALFQFVFTAIKDFVVSVWNALWDKVKSVIDKVWNGFLKPLIDAVWGFIRDTFQRIKDRVSEIWQALWDRVKSVWDTVSGAVKAAIQAFVDEAKQRFENFKTNISNIFDRVREIVQRAVDFIKGIGDGIWSGLKGAINAGIRLLNAAIRGFNRVLSAANAVPGVSVPTIPEIPQLAAGGIVNRPTLAVVGEAGPEAVLPLSRASDFLSASMSSDRPIFIDVRIGEEPITDMIEGVTRRESDSLALALTGGRRV